MLCRDAVRRVHRHTDAAAHADAVDQRDIGFRIGRDHPVQRVFLAEERIRRRPIAIELGVAQGTDIAAGAEGAVAGALDHDDVDMRIVVPLGQHARQDADHPQVQRVQRFRAVQQNAAGPAVAACDHTLFMRHRYVSGIPRRLSADVIRGNASSRVIYWP